MIHKDSITKDKFYDLSVSMPTSKKLPRKDDNQKRSNGWLSTLGGLLG